MRANVGVWVGKGASSYIIYITLQKGVWHVILFEESNSTGSRPSDLIALFGAWLEDVLPAFLCVLVG